MLKMRPFFNPIDDGRVPDKFIEIEKKEFLCPNCHRPFYVEKLPDWMGSDFYKDMCKAKDEELSFLYKKIRELEDKLGPGKYGQ